MNVVIKADNEKDISHEILKTCIKNINVEEYQLFEGNPDGITLILAVIDLHEEARISYRRDKKEIGLFSTRCPNTTNNDTYIITVIIDFRTQ